MPPRCPTFTPGPPPRTWPSPARLPGQKRARPGSQPAQPARRRELGHHASRRSRITSRAGLGFEASKPVSAALMPLSAEPALPTARRSCDAWRTRDRVSLACYRTCPGGAAPAHPQSSGSLGSRLRVSWAERLCRLGHSRRLALSSHTCCRPPVRPLAALGEHARVRPGAEKMAADSLRRARMYDLTVPGRSPAPAAIFVSDVTRTPAVMLGSPAAFGDTSRRGSPARVLRPVGAKFGAAVKLAPPCCHPGRPCSRTGLPGRAEQTWSLSLRGSRGPPPGPLAPARQRLDPRARSCVPP